METLTMTKQYPKIVLETFLLIIEEMDGIGDDWDSQPSPFLRVVSDLIDVLSDMYNDYELLKELDLYKDETPQERKNQILRVLIGMVRGNDVKLEDYDYE